MTPKILIVDDEESVRLFLSSTLNKCGYSTITAASAEEALNILARTSFPLVLTDLKMPGKNGIELVEEIKIHYPETEIVVITAYGSIEKAVEAMKAGASDFLVKPLPDPEYLRSLVGKIFSNIQARNGEILLQSTNSCPFIAEDEKSIEVLKLITLVAPSDASVLLTGETGTGKEVAAQTIHSLSSRSQKAFVAINCASLPEHLLESELFGYEKGAFTGANSTKLGKFILADQGTIFLDEITELSLPLQAKLLRVIQERELELLGSLRTRTVNIRIIAATNKDLANEVAKGRFREDLFYRLNVFPMEISPLRERKKDIIPLTKFFLKNSMHLLEESAQAALVNYSFPGNVRELKNILERALILSQGKNIATSHLLLPSWPSSMLNNPESMEEAEKNTITKALISTNWHRGKAAALLGISLRSLQYKIKKYHLNSQMQKLHS